MKSWSSYEDYYCLFYSFYSIWTYFLPWNSPCKSIAPWRDSAAWVILPILGTALALVFFFIQRKQWKQQF